MAVDYNAGKEAITGGAALGVKTPVEYAAEYVQQITTASRPSEIEVFLALLTAHTSFSGGVKYWANVRNTPASVKLLKQRAKEIVEAY